MYANSKQLSIDHTIFAWSNQKGLDPIHVKKAKGVYLYDEKISQKLGLHKKLIKYLDCDYMCVSHFIMYVLLGYLSPKYWQLSFILSILWEYSEDIGCSWVP